MNLKKILIGKTNYDQIQVLKRIQGSWSDIVGNSIASQSTPIRLLDKKLTIRTKSSLVQSELSMLKQALINRIEEKEKFKVAEISIRSV